MSGEQILEVGKCRLERWRGFGGVKVQIRVVNRFQSVWKCRLDVVEKCAVSRCRFKWSKGFEGVKVLEELLNSRSRGRVRSTLLGH